MLLWDPTARLHSQLCARLQALLLQQLSQLGALTWRRQRPRCRCGAARPRLARARCGRGRRGRRHLRRLRHARLWRARLRRARGAGRALLLLLLLLLLLCHGAAAAAAPAAASAQGGLQARHAVNARVVASRQPAGRIPVVAGETR